MKGSAFGVVTAGWMALMAVGCGASPKTTHAPAATYVEDEVAAGFTAYKDVLRRWGRWSSDPVYTVRWCPDASQFREGEPPFAPYRSRGHWGTSTQPSYGAAAGSPYWTSDDRETWGEITMHRGWWVHLEQGAGAQPWCWIPGVEETPARVVWRTGNGFVGWAPEPPVWVDDGSDGADLEWALCFLGALLEPLLYDQLLRDDAQEAALWGTRSTPSMRATAARNVTHVGPPAEQVVKARQLLAAYVVAHPKLDTGLSSNGTHTAPKPEGISGSAEKPSKDARDTDEQPRPLPFAMTYYSVLAGDPMMGPVGLVPRIVRPKPSAGPVPFGVGEEALVRGSDDGQRGGNDGLHDTRAPAWSDHSSSSPAFASTAHGGSTGSRPSSSSHSTRPSTPARGLSAPSSGSHPSVSSGRTPAHGLSR